MGDAPIRWSGDPSGLQGWQRDLYEYIRIVTPAGIAIGNLPASVQSHLSGLGAAQPADQAPLEAVVMMLVITQQLAGRTSGVISQTMVSRMASSYLAERMMAAPPQLLDEHDPGAGYVMSLQPSSLKPFVMATLLARWQELGFPEDLPPEPEGPRQIGTTLTLPGLGFFVQSASSANGRYRIAWNDGSVTETRAGERWENGRWVVLDGDRVLHSGRLPRPNDGAVSDAGSAVIADWTSEEGLQGDVVFIDTDGTASQLRRYAANLMNVGISASGHFAAVSTLHAPSDDGSIVAVWNLQERTELWRRHVDRVFGEDAFTFDEARSLLWLSSRSGGQIVFHLDGRIATDVDDYAAWLATAAAPSAVATVVALQLDEKGTPDGSQGEVLVQWLNGAVQRSTDPLEQASLLRWMGEIAEDLGQKDKVIEYWRRAVTLNPNVGVKQKLKKLDSTFAVSAAGRGQLVAALDGSIAVTAEWRLDTTPSAIVHAGGTTFIAGLGQSAKGNLLFGDVASGRAMWRVSLPGRVTHIVRADTDAWLVVATQGSVAEGTTSLWRSSTSGKLQLLATLNAVDTGPPVVGAAGIGVGCRDGCLYCLGLDGSLSGA